MENCCERYCLKGTWGGSINLKHVKVELPTCPVKITKGLNPRLKGKARTAQVCNPVELQSTNGTSNRGLQWGARHKALPYERSGHKTIGVEYVNIGAVCA